MGSKEQLWPYIEKEANGKVIDFDVLSRKPGETQVADRTITAQTIFEKIIIHYVADGPSWQEDFRSVVEKALEAKVKKLKVLKQEPCEIGEPAVKSEQGDEDTWVDDVTGADGDARQMSEKEAQNANREKQLHKTRERVDSCTISLTRG